MDLLPNHCGDLGVPPIHAQAIEHPLKHRGNLTTHLPDEPRLLNLQRPHVH